jgi:hypothetical protein
MRSKEDRNAWLRDWRKRKPELAFGRYFRARMRNKYHWPPERYEYILMAQGGKCLICREFLQVATPHSRTSRTSRSAVVDHDHAMDEARGILCNNCNRALGLFSHNIDTMERAANYIRNWERLKEQDSDGTGHK